jgi:hypothetical protein
MWRWLLLSRGAFDVARWFESRRRAFRILGVTKVTYELIGEVK